jgi:formylglycine-generating enzyme required for sulfatase activity
MNSKKLSPAASMFEKVLRAFETRGITYSDVLARLRRLLATGASPTELLPILRRRESTERMPEYARLEALLLEAVEQSTTADEPSGASRPADRVGRDEAAAEASRPEDEVAVDLEFDAPANALDSPRGLRASELDLSVLAQHLRSVEERVPPRAAALEALTRSIEKAREGESAAAERAAALAADLAATGAALQAEQDKLREVEQALAQSVASGEEARQISLQELQQYRSELRALHESLAERDANLDQDRRALAEREAALEQARRTLAEREAALEQARRVSAERDAALDQARRALAERDAALEHARHASAENKVASDQARTALAERDARLASVSLQRVVIEAALEARNRAAAPEAGPRSARAPAERAESPSVATLDVRPEDLEDGPAPAPAAVPEPLLPRSKLSPEGPRTQWLSGPNRAIGGVIGALLLIGFAWLWAHRAPPHSAPAPSMAAQTPGSVIRDCASCPEMTVLPAGRFKQGSARGSAIAQPLHWVVIGRSIAMSTSPVTLQSFEQFVASTGRDMQGCDTYDGEWKHRAADSWQHPGFAQTDAHPVTCVSWSDAAAYAGWLSAKTGHRYRLPSASEWEYAARAGADTPQPWGADASAACSDANVADASAGRQYPGWTTFPCDDGHVYTAPVGSFKANPFGLKDMLGNVLQWTEDCWHDSYAAAPIDGSAWLDGDCSMHELRGASWFSMPAFVRVDYRNRFPADYRTSSVGIRLVREIGP